MTSGFPGKWWLLGLLLFNIVKFCQFLRNNKVDRCSVHGCCSYRKETEMNYQQVRQNVKVVGTAISALAAVVCACSRGHCGCPPDRLVGGNGSDGGGQEELVF